MNRETVYRDTAPLIFRPHGLGRFVGALFLLIWLCFWVVSEVVVLWLFGQGLWAVLTGRPVMDSDTPLRLTPALGIGAFLLVWLTLWTVGGMMAFQELLRLVWAEDRLVLDQDTLWCVRQRGPFTSTRALPRHAIQGVWVRPVSAVLMVKLGSALIVLTDLGTPTEHIAARQRLCAALGWPDDETTAERAGVPDEWQEARGTQGELLLIPNPTFRRQQTGVVAIITGIVWSGLLLLAHESLSEPGLWVVTLMLTVFGVWLARKTHWMLRGRHEWRIERGHLVYQRRFGGVVTELAQAKAVELTESRDSDNDAWFHLHAIQITSPRIKSTRKTPASLRITHAIHDPTEPRCLGQWLSQQADVPFYDRSR